jgi:hypothetical protein
MQARRDLAHADSRLPVGVPKIALPKKEEETSKEPNRNSPRQTFPTAPAIASRPRGVRGAVRKACQHPKELISVIDDNALPGSPMPQPQAFRNKHRPTKKLFPPYCPLDTTHSSGGLSDRRKISFCFVFRRSRRPLPLPFPKLLISVAQSAEAGTVNRREPKLRYTPLSPCPPGGRPKSVELHSGAW